MNAMRGPVKKISRSIAVPAWLRLSSCHSAAAGFYTLSPSLPLSPLFLPICPPCGCHLSGGRTVGGTLQVESWHQLTHCIHLSSASISRKPLLQLGSLKGKDCQFLFHNISRAPFWVSGVSWHSRKLSTGAGEGEPHGKLWTSRQALACTQQNLGRQGTRVASVTPKLYQDELKSGSVTSPSCPVPQPSSPPPPKKRAVQFLNNLTFIQNWGSLFVRAKHLVQDCLILSVGTWISTRHPRPHRRSRWGSWQVQKSRTWTGWEFYLPDWLACN